MSFEVVTVVDVGDTPADTRWLTRLRERFTEVSTVVVTSPGGTLPGSLDPRDLRSHPAIDTAQFVWFLSPSIDPEPGSLPELIEALNSSESLGAVGPKLVREGTREVVSAGVTTTVAGHRLNPAAPREIDSGQYDRTEDVLALDVPGLLVDGDLVRRLGPPSPALAEAYRGIEYSRRIRGAGRRVQLCHTATATVAAEAFTDLGTSERPIASARQLREEHRYRLAVSPRSRLGWTLVLLVLAGLRDTLGHLLANDPVRAWWTVRGLLALGADARATRRLRGTPSGADPDVGLFASDREMSVVRRGLREPDPLTYSAGDPTDLDEVFSGDTEGDVAGFAHIRARSRSVFLHPLTGVLAALSLASVLLFARLIGPGALTGGALPRYDLGFGDLWQRILVPYTSAGLGAQAAADPLLTVVGVLAVPTLGNADLALRILWILALPLAGLVMYACAGRVAPAQGPRAVLALVWACSPAFVFALQTGRLGTLVAWIAAPAAAWALDRAVRGREPGTPGTFAVVGTAEAPGRPGGRGTASSAAGAGLALALVLAGAPFLVLPVLGFLLVLLVLVRRMPLLWVLAAPLGLLGPWLGGVARDLDAFLASPGAVFDYATPRSYELALGFPTHPADLAITEFLPEFLRPWLLLVAALPLVAAGALALMRIGNSLGLLIVSAVLYCAGLGLGIVQSALEGGLTADRLVASWVGDSVVLMALGACGLAAAALWPRPEERKGRLQGAFLFVLVPGAALLVLGVFVTQVFLAGMPLGRDSRDVLPAFAAERASGPWQQRTLVLSESDGELTGALVDTGSGTVLHTSTLSEARDIGGGPFSRRPEPIDAADTALATAIGRLTSGDGNDARDALRDLAVGFVVVEESTDGPGDPAALDPVATAVNGDARGDSDLVRIVGVSPGLTRLGDTDRGSLWQVTPPEGTAPISWASLVAPDGTVTAVDPAEGIPAGEEDRVLVLAEREGLAEVRLDGLPLEALGEADGSVASASGEWRTVLAVPAAGGDLTISRAVPWYTAAAALGLGLLLVTVLVAIPFGRHRRPALAPAEDVRPDTLALPVVAEAPEAPQTGLVPTVIGFVRRPDGARSIVTFTGIAIPGILIATTGFLTPLAGGSVARAAEQIRLPAARTTSVCPGPFQVAADAEGTDSEFTTDPVPAATVQNVTAVTSAPDGSRSAAGVRSELLNGQELYTVGASSGFVSGDDDVIGPVRVSGLPEGESPALVSAVQTVRAGEGDFTGLATLECVRPSTRADFTTARTVVGTDSRLLLANPSQAPVTAHLALSGPTGPVPVLGEDSVSIPAGEQRVVVLAGLASAQDVLGVHVEAEGGLLSAVLQQTRRDGLTPQGIEYAVPSAEASSRTLVPVAGTGEATLHVTNPLPHAVDVGVEYLAESGPVGLAADSVSVPAGATTTLGLGEVPVGTAVVEAPDAFRADVALVRAGDEGRADVAHLASAERLRAQQLLSLPRNADPTFVFSPGNGTVNVTGLREDGSAIGSSQVSVSADRSTVLRPREVFGEDVFGLVLETGQGSTVYAGGFVEAAEGVSGLSVPPAPVGVGYRSIRLER